MQEIIEKLLILQERDRKILRVTQELAHISPERESLRAKAAATPSSTGHIAADIVKLEPLVQAKGDEAVPVVISADKSIQYETVVKVMGALQEAGVARVGLSVQTGK